MFHALSAKKICNLQTNSQKIALTVVDTLDSTNNYLLNQIKAGMKINHICIADAQTAGRGRQQGKVWQSPAKVNIYCSVLWHFAEPEKELTGLSLVVGLAIAKTLQYFALAEIGLKWPNDVWQAKQKIAGVLIEFVKSLTTGSTAVIGVGLNVNIPQHNCSIDQPWTCMMAAAKKNFDRNEVAAVLLDNLLAYLLAFSSSYLPVLLNEWAQWDILYNKKINLNLAGQHYQGIARGVDNHGCLLVDIYGKRQTFSSGEISVRTL